MSAQPSPAELPNLQLQPVTERWLDSVLQVEQAAYPWPWSRGNFEDSMRAGYAMQMLTAGDTVLGYFVAMRGVDEVHLLNLTVAPERQREGWGRLLLSHLLFWSRAHGAHCLWLEVRASNERALSVYRRFGFRTVGRRKAYYPGARSQREDAIVMSLEVARVELPPGSSEGRA